MDKKDRNPYFRAYRDANRECYNEYHRNYYQANKLKNYKRLAAYYQRKVEELELQEDDSNQMDTSKN